MDPIMKRRFGRFCTQRCRDETFIVVSHDMDFGRIPATVLPDAGGTIIGVGNYREIHGQVAEEEYSFPSNGE